MHCRNATVLIDLLWFNVVHYSSLFQYFLIYYGPYSSWKFLILNREYEIIVVISGSRERIPPEEQKNLLVEERWQIGRLTKLSLQCVIVLLSKYNW